RLVEVVKLLRIACEANQAEQVPLAFNDQFLAPHGDDGNPLAVPRILLENLGAVDDVLADVALLDLALLDLAALIRYEIEPVLVALVEFVQIDWVDRAVCV